MRHHLQHRLHRIWIHLRQYSERCIKVRSCSIIGQRLEILTITAAVVPPETNAQLLELVSQERHACPDLARLPALLGTI